MSETKDTIAERFAEAGLDEDRFIGVMDGQKGSIDHDTRYEEPLPRGNYGIYAEASDELVCIDVDDYDDVEDASGLLAVTDLPETLIQETPHGGEHRFYRVPMDDDGRMVSAVLKDVFGVTNPNPTYGEIRVANQYVVGAGSQLDGCTKDWCDSCDDEDGGRYGIKNDAPIAELDADTLVDAIARDAAFAEDDEDEDEDEDESREPGGGDVAEDVDERIRYALEESGDEKLKRLWRGDYSDYGGDRSRAECALAAKLAFWIGEADKREVARLMDKSSAKKWHERDDDSYRSTVLEAVDTVTEFYEAGGGSSTSEGVDAAAAATDGGGTDTQTTTSSSTTSPATTASPSASGSEWGQIRAQYRNDDVDNNRARYSAAQLLLENNHFVNVRESDELYSFDPEEGFYRPKGDREVRELVLDGLQEHFRRSEVGEMAEQIRARTTRPYDDMGGPAETLPLTNGVLDLDSRELREHDPEDLFLHRCPVEFDPEADCPQWREFLKDSVPSESEREKLQEFVGYALMHWNYRFHKALFIVGPQASGKSTFLDTVRTLLGANGVASLTPHQMTERFGSAELFGKWANIRSDIPSKMIENTGEFKEITAGDAIKAERKGKDPFMFKPTTKHFYSANTLPDTQDEDDAFWRRILLVAFPSSVPPAKRDRRLPDKLLDELPGILNWALDGLQRLRDQRGFTADREPGATADTWSKWGSTVDRFASVCLRDETGADPIPKKDVYHRYIRFCEQENMPAEPQRQFTRRLKTEHGVEDGKASVNGRQQRSFFNISYTTRAEAYEQPDDDVDDRDSASQQRF